MQNICNIKMHQKSNIYQWKMAFGEPFTERHNMASYFYKNAIRKKKSVVSREHLNLYAPVCYSYTLWHTWNYRLQLTKFKVRLETFFRKVTWNMTIFSTIQSTTIKSSRNLWTSAHTVKTFSLGALFFCCYLSKLPPEFAWSASVYLCRLSSVWTFKSLGILLLIKLFSEHSCPADWSTVTTPTVLLFSHIFFFYPLSRALSLNHVRKMHPSPIFCLLRTEWRMTAEVFFPSLCKRPQSAMLDHIPCKRISKFINGIFVFGHRFRYDNILPTDSI